MSVEQTKIALIQNFDFEANRKVDIYHLL